MIKFPDYIEDIYVIGDIHGNFDFVKYKIRSLHLSNCLIILCGDVGMGFQPELDKSKIAYLNKLLKIRSIYVVAIRGNHDDPNFFTDSELTSNWLNVADYTVLNVQDEHILCVGGGTSIDRSYRKANNWGYWENEKAIYQPKVEYPINVICSHISPSFCHPLVKGQVVDFYAKDDPTLIQELDEERELMNRVYEDYKDTLTHWYYGHYHVNYIEVINGVKFTLLGCEKFSQHYGK